MTQVRWTLNDEVFMVLKGKTLMPAVDGLPNPALAAVYKDSKQARQAAEKLAEMAGAVLHPNNRDDS